MMNDIYWCEYFLKLVLYLEQGAARIRLNHVGGLVRVFD